MSELSRTDGEETLFARAMVLVFDEHRHQRGWTWRQLSDDLGIHESLMSQYRSGKKSPSLSRLVAFDSRIPGFWERVLVHYRGLPRATTSTTQ